jgi:hypothetical protein
LLGKTPFGDKTPLLGKREEVEYRDDAFGSNIGGGI